MQSFSLNVLLFSYITECEHGQVQVLYRGGWTRLRTCTELRVTCG